MPGLRQAQNDQETNEGGEASAQDRQLEGHRDECGKSVHRPTPDVLGVMPDVCVPLNAIPQKRTDETGGKYDGRDQRTPELERAIDPGNRKWRVCLQIAVTLFPQARHRADHVGCSGKLGEESLRHTAATPREDSPWTRP